MTHPVSQTMEHFLACHEHARACCVRSFVGALIRATGEAASRSFSTAQLDRARSRAKVRLAWISAPRSTIPSIRSTTSRRLMLTIGRFRHLAFFLKQ
jgi:hypothetical protein